MTTTEPTGYRPPKNKTKTRFVVCDAWGGNMSSDDEGEARRDAERCDSDFPDDGPHKVFKVTTTREVMEVERPSEPPAHTVTYDPAKGGVVIDGPFGADTHFWFGHLGAFTPDNMNLGEARAILAEAINGESAS